MIFRALLPSLLLAVVLHPTAQASIAYGSINNFDTVNDTGHECHGFEIELDDCHSTDITYTYNYNHYGVPEITEDNSVPGHTKVFIRWQSKKNADGTWAAFTAIPSGPIAPTNGHMFTNPAVNFGGEHFGVGYKIQPTAVLYNWLIDGGSGTLVHGGAVQVSTPTFTYFPPVAAQAAQVVAVIAPPPPPAPPVKEFGKAVWVKEIKTTTHNPEKIKLRELVSDDPDHSEKKNWKNGEPDEVEVEWRILQRKTSAADGGPNNNVAAAAEPLPNGNEVVTRRYEFYKYTGPMDEETGEAMADAVGADGSHGTGSRTYATRFDNATGEWVVETKDMANFVVVGDFTGSQMAAVDVESAVGLIDHVGEGKVNKVFAPRAIVVEGSLPFTCTHSGTIPPGLTMNDVTGVLSGMPTASGQFQFSVTASDGINPDVQKNYTMTVAAANAALPAQALLDTSASPVGTGSTAGDGSYAPGTNATVTATPEPGYKFVSWTDNAVVVSNDLSYTLVMDVNHSLVANFAPDVMQWSISTSPAPVAGGTTTGDGLYDDGSNVTVIAVPDAGYAFTNWTEAGAIVSTSASYTFVAGVDRDLVANFTLLPTYTVTTNPAPLAGGTTSGDGSFLSGSNATVTATPNAGCFFVNWTVAGAQVSTIATYTFAVTANKALTANFSPVGTTPRSITTSSSPAAGGSTAGGGSYVDGTSVTVEATPNAGYKFNKWKQGGSNVSSSASYTFTVSADRALVATFTPVYVIGTASNPANAGTTEADSASYNPGDGGNVKAFPAAGYQFVNWTENGVIVSTSATFNFTNVQANHTYVANFAVPGGVNISTASAPAAGGSTDGAGSYLIGDDVIVSALDNPGYAFTNWTEGGAVVSTTADYAFTASVSRSLVANFMPVVQYTISTGAAPSLAGTVDGAGIYNSGSSVTLTATSNPGYIFVNWTNGLNVVGSNATYTFTAAANATLVAHFAQGVEILTDVSPPLAGTTTGGGPVPSGTSTTLNATANAGYTFLNWTDGSGNVVSTNASYTFTPAASDTFVANFDAPVVGVHFDFDSGDPALALHATVPFTQVSGGITATFTTPNANPPTVENAASTGHTLSKFSGKYLAPSNDAGTVIEVAFDQQITGAQLTFATVEPVNVAVASHVQITAYDNSSGAPVLVGTALAHGAVVAGDSMPSGTLVFNSANGPFDSIRIELPDFPDGAPKLLIDDIVVSPGGNTGGYLTLANPNWNITLTDSGYSDFLLDNTPGFVGREYLSGEWGSAIGYTRNGTVVSPTWFEPQFSFPDWQTNSDFHVVEGIRLVGTNADGLPIARSILANNDLQVTLTFEMIDTVTGTPMGVTAASSAGTPKSVNSNRYVLSQSFSIKNISGSSLTNVQLFQLLHGFTSQSGVYDNRSYAGKLSSYQYDATLAGVDQSSIGVDGASTTGLEDYIAFHSKVAPSAFEIGAYGTEGNGIDDHVMGKPGDGVHLSIENNWQNAPWLGRKNRDVFTPAARWVAGGQRWELGTIASGQSVNFDIVLSLLTGTTVTITGGGGSHTGGGSCNGGSQHVGGLDFEFADIQNEGTFFGEYTEADDNELLERENDGEFALPAFEIPGGAVTQLWNLSYSGSHSGLITLKFHYNPALLPAGYDERQLTIRHFTNGAWEQLVGNVDTVHHIITVTTSSLSPFALATPTANAIPKITQTVTAPGAAQLQWTSDTTGWVLQQSNDLVNWTNSAAVINTAGSVSTTTISGVGAGTFFRLAHP